MNSKLFLIVLLVISSCSTQKNSTLDLLDCVPQNSVITIQLNDQNMLENAINNLPFLSNILAIDTVLYKKISAVIPENFNHKALLSFTPVGKSEYAISFIYKPVLKDSVSEVVSEKIKYNNIPVNINIKKDTKTFIAKIEGVRIISTSKLVIENSIRNIQNNQPGIQNHYYFDLAKISDDNAPMNLLIHQDFKDVLKSFFS